MKYEELEMRPDEIQSKVRSKLANVGGAEYAVFVVGALVVGMFIFASFQLTNS